MSNPEGPVEASLTPIARQRLADDLAQRISRLIQAGTYHAGDRLPAITSMARQFGVGSPTVREALRKLEAVGVVDIRHGSGVYVTGTADSLVISNPVFEGRATKKLLVDLLEARTPIEVTTATLAATHATAADLDAMRELLANAGASLDDAMVLNATNLAFHGRIAAASGNVVLRQLLEVLSRLFREEQRLIIDIFGSRRRDHDEHLAILDALERRDPALAAARMQAHLDGVRDVLRRWEPERD
ncbi:GntR domain protein (plasmid) [Gemmatirosa kalamazoonensis]|jgi:GntR family transcriptional repressor for pyruvate dehydrogenase complex|uniref:GntR domain protein n=1 Tax=Gemmatirosa kalamazoonensis TaxID=861299 RepID=W0RPP7_9BACT|nr:FCD domain-containing protein [Gemmatirosa kalamazoonensis]AHG92979.1 GntR domain protein [Gemmatirosa kalamazoonensis]